MKRIFAYLRIELKKGIRVIPFFITIVSGHDRCAWTGACVDLPFHVTVADLCKNEYRSCRAGSGDEYKNGNEACFRNGQRGQYLQF